MIVLVASACGSESKGAYSATITGALAAGVSGPARAQKTGLLNSSGDLYLITMDLPKTMAGMEKYQGGLVQLVAGGRPPTGEYRAISNEGGVYPVDAFTAHFGGPNDVTWNAVDGRIQIVERALLGAGSKGSFRLRFVNTDTGVDTIVVAGQFDAR